MDLKHPRPLRLSRRLRLAAAVLGLGLTAGCQSLLPEASSRTDVPWRHYEDARQAIDSIEPYRTSREDLSVMGIDPATNPAITVLTYSDLLQRFAAGSALHLAEYDSGIRDCLSAGKKCTGYSLQIRRVRRERVGNFWLDSLNFRREIDITGWSFNSLIVLVDDTVVYTLYGGQPTIRDHERTRNPLGPLQGWGDAVQGLVR